MAGDHVGSPLQRKNIKRSDSAGALSLQKKVKQMKFITVKELATQMKKNREIISKEKVIITWKGKPITSNANKRRAFLLPKPLTRTIAS